jgi:hypothetical protein
MTINTHPIQRTFRLLLLTLATAAVVGPAALAGGVSGPATLASPMNIPKASKTGCADFGLVFHIDTCASRPNARIIDAAHDDYMFRDFFRGTHWQRRGT